MSQDVSPRIFVPAAAGTYGPGRSTERWIDGELAQSFPASDPPSWTMGNERSAEGNERSADPRSAAPARRNP